MIEKKNNCCINIYWFNFISNLNNNSIVKDFRRFRTSFRLIISFIRYKTQKNQYRIQYQIFWFDFQIRIEENSPKNYSLKLINIYFQIKVSTWRKNYHKRMSLRWIHENLEAPTCDEECSDIDDSCSDDSYDSDLSIGEEKGPGSEKEINGDRRRKRETRRHPTTTVKFDENGYFADNYELSIAENKIESSLRCSGINRVTIRW